VSTDLTERPARGGLTILLILAAVKFLIHLTVNATGGYGIFRDELYYIACSNHLAAGYVDQPPFSIFVLSVSRFIFGDSLFALRLLPALAGAGTLLITGLMVRTLGGSTLACVIASLAVIVSPIFLGMNAVYSMNAFDIFFWTLAAYLTLIIIQSGSLRTWLLLGCVVGIGALNKISMLWLAAGIGTGFLLPPHTKTLRTAAPWLAAGVAFLFFLPYILWNVANGFPHLEFIHNATLNKYAGLSRAGFIAGQFLINNPVTVPVWLGGLFFLFFRRNGRSFRPLGIAYLVVLAILTINGKSKAEYLSPAYPMLFAAGGVMWEGLSMYPRGRWLRIALPLLLVSGLIFAPLVLPVLPVDSYATYARSLGIQPSSSEGKKLSELPQFFADMFGWEEKTDSVAAVFRRLDPEDQAHCAIYAGNYGRCGAIDYYGRKYGLPQSIGRHNNYWLWGPGNFDGSLLLVLGSGVQDWRKYFDSVETASTVSSPHCMPYEDSLSVYICRGLRVPVSEFWNEIKVYD
jgi:hypothetical protein